MMNKLLSLKSKQLLWILIIVFGAALAIRMYDLKDAPFDFNPTRQFRGALISRYLYYQMIPDASPEVLDKVDFFRSQQEDLEPLIIESIMAVSYKIAGGEFIWLVRIYNSLFWLIGGWFLYLLANKTGSKAASLTALAFYLFLPFSVQASRSFQPDPMMVMWIIVCTYAAFQWAEHQNWTWAWRTGVAGGLAVLSKGNAAFYIGMMMAALVMVSLGLRNGFRERKVWAIGALMLAPILIHYIFVLGGKFGNYVNRAAVRNYEELFSPRFYFNWMSRVDDFLNLALIGVALLGVLVAKDRLKAILVGLWLGYAFTGLVFHYHITTHDYYHLVLPFLVALSIVPILDLFFNRLEEEAWPWQLLGVLGLVMAAAYGLFRARSILLANDYTSEAAFWQQLGEELPDDGRTASIVPFYGYPLMYYGWQKTDILFPEGFDSFETDSYAYLLVVKTDQFNSDLQFKQNISENYPLLVDGGYYFIYDLRLARQP